MASIFDSSNFDFLSFSNNFLSQSLFQVSHNVKAGDEVNCTISELQPLKAEPEEIPLDIVYEDKHVIVVNKPAHMVITFFSILGLWLGMATSKEYLL